MKRGRWALRLAAGAVIFLALGGPAPGNVGGCGTVPVADSRGFCVDKRDAECRRDHFAGRIDDVERDQCLREIETRCTGSAWPPGCSPTVDQTEACLTILLRMDLASIPTDELLDVYSECNVCPVGAP